MQGCKGKPAIEQWIAFWFRGPSKYHAPRSLVKEIVFLAWKYYLSSSIMRFVDWVIVRLFLMSYKWLKAIALRPL